MSKFAVWYLSVGAAYCVGRRTGEDWSPLYNAGRVKETLFLVACMFIWPIFVAETIYHGGRF